MTNLLIISTVVPDAPSAGKMLLVARFKDTDKQPISAANRVRCIELPSNIWSDDSSASRVKDDNLLALFLHDATEDLAKSYLATIVRDSNWLRTQVPEEDFYLSKLLAWQQEQASAAGRLNGDTIRAWLANSVTISTIKQKHGDAIATALGDTFVKLAGPNHGVTKEKAEKILSNLWQVQDADDNTGLRVLLRLQSIRDKDSTANLLDSIL